MPVIDGKVLYATEEDMLRFGEFLCELEQRYGGEYGVIKVS
jgi:hypothetical protein